MKIAFFCKSDKPTVREALRCLRKYCEIIHVYEGQRGDAFPKEAINKSADILISYISPWIIPETILNRTKYWNINFHPGPPEYPGIGCFNFALYNEEENFGVTAHIMEKHVDSGKIIGVKRFPVSKGESVYDLSLKTYEHLFLLFSEVIDYIMKNKSLPEIAQNWARKPYKRVDLEALCQIDPKMSKAEVEKRIRSTNYPGMPGAYIDLFKHKFKYNFEE